MAMTFDNPYSSLDRLLHRIAFAGSEVQKSLADVEDAVYRSVIRRIQVSRPVFVTALPRAGTTLLLELLASLPGFASHTYRDMPFLMCPLLWNTVSSLFRRSAPPRERAHGDGMLIGYDSPEAFEEILWRAFWPDHYDPRYIRPWEPDEDANEFAEFFINHIRKVIALRTRQDQSDRDVRYVSKNNVNIARISLLTRLFPDCVIVVPFREPTSHVSSLLRQHRHFAQIHAHDRFARAYMESIGHLEFGLNLRPINFAHWCEGWEDSEAASGDFWLRYWIRTYERVLHDAHDNLALVSYDRCCAAPNEAMIALAGALRLEDADELIARSSRLRAPTIYPANEISASDDLLRRASELHDRLGTRAIY